MTREEFDEILEQTNAVICNREWYERAVKALETLEEFEKAQIITGGRLNGRTYAYKCGLEDGKRKALEQEPCEDCISREEVCDYIAEFVNHEYATDREREMVKHIIGGIQHLSSIQPKPKTTWIPVSERMPEDWDEYVITIRERWGEDEEWDYETTTAYYQNGKWSPSYDVDEGQEWEVIAWMPLPEPYKAESEN